MPHHFFAYMNRMKYIRRWGLMRNTQAERFIGGADVLGQHRAAGQRPLPQGL